MYIYLTSSEAIRATLGVSDDSDELPDSAFLAADLETEIELEMETWLSRMANTSVSAVNASTASRAKKAIPICAKYIGALLLLPALSTATASKHSDGQDEFQRQDRDIEELRETLQALLNRYQAVILDDLGASATTLAFSIMGSASPAFDPITGV